MKCPHCERSDRKPKVLETRTVDGTVYRRRLCGWCFKSFVTREEAPPGLRLPEGRDRSARLKPGQQKFNTQHLMELWK
jgi:hypothetical protein